MKCIYEAFDGTQFADEDECIEYESKLCADKITEDLIEVYNENLEKIPFEEISDKTEEWYLVHLGKPDEDWNEIIDNYFDYLYNWEMSYCCIDELRDSYNKDGSGWYLFDAENEEWISEQPLRIMVERFIKIANIFDLSESKGRNMDKIKVDQNSSTLTAEMVMLEINNAIEEYIEEIVQEEFEEFPDTLQINKKKIVDAIKKQIPVKVAWRGIISDAGMGDEPICPICSRKLKAFGKYCSGCGQAIDWNKVEE